MLVSIVIRTLNEARHLGDLLYMIAQQSYPCIEIETIIVDSGSTDNTLEIAEHYGAIITTISKQDFSFGRSLNRGCEWARGEIVVIVSGHCVPVDAHWLRNLCNPIQSGQVCYTYGGQIGDDNSNFSERRIFSKYFPKYSAIPQVGFFCNNANAAILREAWNDHRFDESITGLEDMELAKRLVNSGHKIGYVADALVFHHHQESWVQVRRRFEREALALRTIMPEIHLTRLDVLRFIITSTLGDWWAAWRNGIRTTSKLDMLRYRYNQYLGSLGGNHEHRVLSQQSKERLFYPNSSELDPNDKWLKPMRRASPDESQQPEG
jgi:rhamnosyltransferase